MFDNGGRILSNGGFDWSIVKGALADSSAGISTRLPHAALHWPETALVTEKGACSGITRTLRVNDAEEGRM